LRGKFCEPQKPQSRDPKVTLAADLNHSLSLPLANRKSARFLGSAIR